MKNIISTIAVTALFAAFATPAHAATRMVTQGRAGYAVMPAAKSQTSATSAGRETTVALVMEKPRQTTITMQPAGRAGYQYLPTRTR